MDSLGTRIRTKREAKGFTQAQVAEMLGKKSKQVISNWENGVAEPSLSDLRVLAELLGTTTGYLLDGQATEELPSDYADLKDRLMQLQEQVIFYQQQELEAQRRKAETLARDKISG